MMKEGNRATYMEAEWATARCKEKIKELALSMGDARPFFDRVLEDEKSGRICVRLTIMPWVAEALEGSLTILALQEVEECEISFLCENDLVSPTADSNTRTVYIFPSGEKLARVREED